METCKNLIEAEKAIQRKHMELARREYEDYLQRLAESTPSEGSDGKPLVKTRTIGMRVATGFGPVELKVKNGLCRSSGRYETPMRLRFFGGRRGCVSPAFEMRIAATAMETGSFEKASKLCREWGCPVSDDKVMDVVRDIAGRCEEGKLPRLCEEAAGSEDTLVIMMDGWFARHRGAGWGKRNPRAAERVEWREMKSATIFKLAHAAETSGGRRVLVTKHAVCMPAGTDPVDFGRKVEFEARRMGMMQAKFVYIVMAAPTSGTSSRTGSPPSPKGRWTTTTPPSISARSPRRSSRTTSPRERRGSRSVAGNSSGTGGRRCSTSSRRTKATDAGTRSPCNARRNIS
jgi:hypothetical protein